MKIDPVRIAKLPDSDYQLLYTCIEEIYSGTEETVRPESFAAAFLLLRNLEISVRSFYDVKLASIKLRGLRYTIDCLRAYIPNSAF